MSASLSLVDICVNLANSQFNDDRAELLTRSKLEQVDQLILTATDLNSASWLQGFIRNNTHKSHLWPQLYCTAGVHPHDAQELLSQDNWQQQLKTLVQANEVVAVGETGLDFFRNFSSQAAQREVFEYQIELACKIEKPLFVHDRESDGAVLQQLANFSNLPATVIHCFTGTRDELTNYLDAGFYIGITGWVADPKRGVTLRELVADIPLSRLLIETDAPFLKPHNIVTPDLYSIQKNKYKRRNEPAYLPFVLDAITSVRKESKEEIAVATSHNAHQIFGLI